MSTNTLISRVQCKRDTEANWITNSSFVPLNGEIIVYVADSTHPFPRMKIGDGQTTIANLEFINSGSAEKVNHTLTFGNGTYQFDGSTDVTVPVYTGGMI